MSVTTAALAAGPAPAASELNLTGADVVVYALERQGIEYVTGMPGGALLPLYDALTRRTRIRHILARHEQAGGFIAQGMARLTGRAAVCLATSGPGVTNVLTALADAKLDSVPLVCITGQVPTALIGTDAFQEVATLDLARPITKAAWTAKSAADIADLIAEAFHVAEAGRPGPVLLDIPKDVQLERCAQPAAARRRESARLPRCGRACDSAAQLINGAQRPVLYVGGGVVKARAEQALLRLAEQGGIPVATTLMAMGVLPHDHPLNLGMLGMHGARATNRVIHECDVLIAIGARFDDRATGDPARFAPHAKIVHIDVDAREFGKILQPAVVVHADAWSALTALLSRVNDNARTAWLSRVRALQANDGESTRKSSSSDATFSVPHDAIRAVAAALPHDVIVTTDVGQHQMWVAQSFPFTRADRWLTSGGLGTMGFGLPAAIGAALAEPHATVVCFTGDGSLLINLQELATLAELALDVKIVLFDNGGYGLVHQQQSLFYGGRYSASRFARACDFVALAQSFGIPATDLSVDEDAHRTLEAALQKAGPCLLRIPVPTGTLAMPMVPPGCANIEALA